jgi:uncharacterized protein (TIGR04255 family)
VRLANPPVVEVGINFHFDPDPEKKLWDLPVAMPFVEQFKESLPHVEIVRAEEIRIEKRSPQGLPEKLTGHISLDQVRAHDEGEQRWLEVGDDRMAYRLLHGSEAYPGFDVVLERAIEILGQYIQHFRPTAVRRAILSYVDIIKIPGQSIELDDYFQLQVNLPEDPFGPLGGFAIHFILPQTPGSDGLQLMFTTEPKREDGSLHFRMQWQSLCEGIYSLDNADLRHRLTAAHEHLVKCFLACFTAKGLDLFNPTGVE